MFSLLALVGCGGPASSADGMRVSLLVDRAAGPLNSYRIRIFGAAVKCNAVLANPAAFELGAQSTCAPAEADTSSSCLIAFDAFDASGGTDSINEVSPGQRTVFVEGISGGNVAAHGCAAVTVSSGQAASVQVTLQ